MRLVTSTSNYLFRFSLERGVMHYRDSSNRLTKLISMTLRGILRLDTTSARDLASVVGQILSTVLLREIYLKSCPDILKCLLELQAGGISFLH